jgi:transposase-like protein
MLGNIAVTEICQKYEIQPSQYYTWQKVFFETGFEESRSESINLKKANKRIKNLEARIQQKDQVLAELMQEHISLKKSFNGVED